MYFVCLSRLNAGKNTDIEKGCFANMLELDDSKLNGYMCNKIYSIKNAQ
jgi:dTDP-4-dehydrorhamnose 3,5-epimerase-like enzyme